MPKRMQRGKCFKRWEGRTGERLIYLCTPRCFAACGFFVPLSFLSFTSFPGLLWWCWYLSWGLVVPPIIRVQHNAYYWLFVLHSASTVYLYGISTGVTHSFSPKYITQSR